LGGFKNITDQARYVIHKRTESIHWSWDGCFLCESFGDVHSNGSLFGEEILESDADCGGYVLLELKNAVGDFGAVTQVSVGW